MCIPVNWSHGLIACVYLLAIVCMQTQGMLCVYVCTYACALCCSQFVCISTRLTVPAQHGQTCPHSVNEFVCTPLSIAKDTLRFCLVYGLVRLVDVLHGDGVGELVEHPLLESLQPLVVMAAAHKLLILQRGKEKALWG